MLTYLSMPFSHPDPQVVAHRMETFWKAMAHWTSSGVCMVSPMALQPMLAICPEVGQDWAAWARYSETLLQACAHMMVLALPGWDASVGVQGELALAERLNIPVVFIRPDTFELCSCRPPLGE